MRDFDIIWKFAAIGLLLGINLSLGMIKFKLDSIESLLVIPETELPEYDEDRQGE
jgi:hypothetical protein